MTHLAEHSTAGPIVAETVSALVIRDRMRRLIADMVALNRVLGVDLAFPDGRHDIATGPVMLGATTSIRTRVLRNAARRRAAPRPVVNAIDTSGRTFSVACAPAGTPPPPEDVESWRRIGYARPPFPIVR